jgi:hypothetical protein
MRSSQSHQYRIISRAEQQKGCRVFESGAARTKGNDLNLVAVHSDNNTTLGEDVAFIE